MASVAAAICYNKLMKTTTEKTSESGPALDEETCHRAFSSRDARFDGVFFLGVTSTGIYCRTVCRARKPLRKNCRFFANASLAELAGFRPCKLCRPEHSPGVPSIDFGSSLLATAVQHIEQGALSDGQGVTQLAENLGVSSRHLRRIFQQRMGVTPIQLAQTQRMLMAKRLLSETRLPILEIALAGATLCSKRAMACHLPTFVAKRNRTIPCSRPPKA
jgi:AraC family transcriptional regulator, regulatory protein of adaptative response / DNA-3-methyladenine glycosylase II